MLKTIEPDSSIAPIKYFILKVLSLKYFYLICVFLCFVAAFLYNTYSHPVYEANASISPIENKTSSLLSSNELFSGLESLQSLNSIENDINNLKSYELVHSTVTGMNLEVSYFTEKQIFFRQTKEIYGSSPFIVNIDKTHIQPIEVKIYITYLDDSSYRLTASQKKVSMYNYLDNDIVIKDIPFQIDTICTFNETLINSKFKFSVTLDKSRSFDKSKPENLYYFTFHHLDYLAKGYLGKMKVEKVSPLSSIISVRFTGKSRSKTITFINRFLNAYLEGNLAKKNQMAVSTVKFIDSQISEISDSLNMSESELRNYRSANQVMDLSFQGQRIYDQLSQIEAERANLQVQERYYNYVINYFKANQDMEGVVPPSAMNVNDPFISQLISELHSLNAQRSSITSGSSTEKNIFLGQIDNKIRLQKQVIIENFTNNLNTLTLTLNELNYRENKLSRDISKLPRTEMNMVSMERKFSLDDAIYTYLLQKSFEAAISLASNYPDYEILEPAREITSKIISPKSTINYMLALFFAFLIPTMFIVIRDFFDDKIRSINDVEFLLHRSVLSVIYSNRQKSEAVVTEYPKSAISESFRNLRSSLFLKSDHEQSKVILITSSQPQDGKSFISFNLASSIASVGYKTILIDCDLRRPTLHTKIKEDNSYGLTNYMIKKASPDDIIRKSYIENLDFIAAGPIVPNPSELLESGVLDDLLSFLIARYKYIIIDTTPVGIVADATLMMKYASKILMIIRNNYTRKDIFNNVVSNLKTNKYNNYDIIFNDLNLHKSSYRHYSNYYITD